MNEKITFHNDNFQLQSIISLKSLPSLDIKDSLENIKLKKQDKYQRKNILPTFVKGTKFENRAKYKLYQGKKMQDLKKKSNPELNIHKMRQKLLLNENGFKYFDIHKFGKKIINHFKKEISESGSSQTNNNNKKGKYRNNTTKLQYESNNQETETNIIHSFKKLNINDIKKSTSQYQLNIHKKSEILLKSDNSLSHANNEYTNNINQSKFMDNSNLFTQKQLDFSSGDVKHLNDVACSSNNCIENQSEILSSKRKSVQWNREVDVVYYAGDLNGGECFMEFFMHSILSRNRKHVFLKFIFFFFFRKNSQT